ncbi:CoA pyrophosphatase [Phanerochaete sordida]|uniref:CoA pyrophosphatase n=1 Tax=Phanerochaete sordida TaxID=48140 RepID=A0A9P3FZU1_9APHY|nr:CoA pyrophosphatase [Phanerochaete sordida]
MTVLHTQPPDFSGLSKRSQQCIERLLAHKAEDIDLSNVPKKKRAGVLVLLYEKNDTLRVLLTTRSKTLRTHPGQTALPGGKMDETDKDIVDTAYREAFEEVALPLQHPSIHTLCVLRPFVALTKLLVSPVVTFLTDLAVLDNLIPSQGEVDVIFDHPLEALLDPQLSAQENLVEVGSELWPYEEQFYNYTDSQWTWLGNSWYKMHRFRSSASAIKGLTAEILIMTATIAFGRPPSYTRYAPGQPTTFADILRALDSESTYFTELREARLPQPGGVIVGRV